MGEARNESSKREQRSIEAELFEAISHPARIRILQWLHESPLTFSGLKQKLGITSSGHLSHHLTKLSRFVEINAEGLYVLGDQGHEAFAAIQSIKSASSSGIQAKYEPQAARIKISGVIALKKGLEVYLEHPVLFVVLTLLVCYIMGAKFVVDEIVDFLWVVYALPTQVLFSPQSIFTSALLILFKLPFSLMLAGVMVAVSCFITAQPPTIEQILDTVVRNSPAILVGSLIFGIVDLGLRIVTWFLQVTMIGPIIYTPLVLLFYYVPTTIGLIVTLVVLLMLFVYVPVIVIENRGLKSALKTSYDLMKGNLVAAFVLVFVCQIIALGLPTVLLFLLLPVFSMSTVVSITSFMVGFIGLLPLAPQVMFYYHTRQEKPDMNPRGNYQDYRAKETTKK